jgi:hypothetical protein
MRRAPARSEQVIAGAAEKEWTTPRRVVTSMRDVLASDPDRVPIDRSRAVITPTRPWRVAHL